MNTKHLSIRVPRGAPGDTVAVSALVRDLATYRPDYRISVVGAFADDLFRYDPRVSMGEPADAVPIVIDYRKSVDSSATDRTQRYLGAAHQCYTEQTGDPLPLDDVRPSLRLGPDESDSPYAHPYAVVVSGTKSDIPLKQAPHDLFAEVVSSTRHLNWKQAGRVEPGRISHNHRAIPSAENLLGKTSIRELIRLIAHAEVVLCHVSLPMLLASAFRVPCVVIGGGREDPWFHQCEGTTYLHTIGKLACCLTAGCRAVFPAPVHKESRYPLGTLCADPVTSGDIMVGRCMTLITKGEVVDAVLRTIT